MNVLSSGQVNFGEVALGFAMLEAYMDIQNVAETIMYDEEFVVDEIPSSVLVEGPANAGRGIDSPPVNFPDDAMYNFNLILGMDNDEFICKGDYIGGYESASLCAVSGTLPDEEGLYVREVTQGCHRD